MIPRPSRSGSIAARVGCVGFLVAVSAGAGVDAGAPEDAGSAVCSTSDDCAPPAPYCHPTRGVCVQCIGDLNCSGISNACDQAKGVCTSCVTNADCSTLLPYCSAALDRCVECVTDANCGSSGIHCRDGVCGTCGDGVCTDLEFHTPNMICKDCLPDCSREVDLGSKTGDNVVSGTLPALTTTSRSSLSSCGAVTTGFPIFGWTAPSTGNFAFDAGVSTTLAIVRDNCAGSSLSCLVSPAVVLLQRGQRVSIMISLFPRGGASPFTIAIHSTGTCDPRYCPAMAAGVNGCCVESTDGGGACGTLGPDGCKPIEGTGGTAGIPDAQTCSAEAARRGDPSCSGGSPGMSVTAGGSQNAAGRATGAGGNVAAGSSSGGRTSISDAMDAGTRASASTSRGGCGCSIPGGHTERRASVVLLAGLGLASSWRRRQRFKDRSASARRPFPPEPRARERSSR